MLFHRLLGLALLMVLVTRAAAAPPADYDEMIRTDILVVGATPCGISAAISAARCGSRVILADMTGFETWSQICMEALFGGRD